MKADRCLKGVKPRLDDRSGDPETKPWKTAEVGTTEEVVDRELVRVQPCWRVGNQSHPWRRRKQRAVATPRKYPRPESATSYD